MGESPWLSTGGRPTKAWAVYCLRLERLQAVFLFTWGGLLGCLRGVYPPSLGGCWRYLQGSKLPSLQGVYPLQSLGGYRKSLKLLNKFLQLALGSYFIQVASIFYISKQLLFQIINQFILKLIEQVSIQYRDITK